jgi:hypothetical protein
MAKSSATNIVKIEDESSTGFHKAALPAPMLTAPIRRDHLLFGQVVYFVSV